jgi:hypothetical protein
LQLIQLEPEPIPREDFGLEPEPIPRGDFGLESEPIPREDFGLELIPLGRIFPFSLQSLQAVPILPWSTLSCDSWSLVSEFSLS